MGFQFRRGRRPAVKILESREQAAATDTGGAQRNEKIGQSRIRRDPGTSVTSAVDCSDSNSIDLPALSAELGGITRQLRQVGIVDLERRHGDALMPQRPKIGASCGSSRAGEKPSQ